MTIMLTLGARQPSKQAKLEARRARRSRADSTGADRVHSGHVGVLQVCFCGAKLAELGGLATLARCFWGARAKATRKPYLDRSQTRRPPAN